MPEFQKPSCPECNQKDPVRHAKDTGEWYCWKKVGGCGAKWQPGVKAAAAVPPPAPTPPPATATISTPELVPVEHSDRDRLILRQVALKAAVEFCPPAMTVDHVTAVAEIFNDWLNGRNVQSVQSAQNVQKPALPAAPRKYVTGLREGEDLATAARRAFEEHDPLAGIELADEEPPHPADTWEGPSNRTPVRETLRAGAPRR